MRQAWCALKDEQLFHSFRCTDWEIQGRRWYRYRVLVVVYNSSVIIIFPPDLCPINKEILVVRSFKVIRPFITLSLEKKPSDFYKFMTRPSIQPFFTRNRLFFLRNNFSGAFHRPLHDCMLNWRSPAGSSWMYQRQKKNDATWQINIGHCYWTPSYLMNRCIRVATDM